jgi:AbiTii-like protein
MSILREIQDAAVDSKSDLGTLLRKCKVLAARLDSEPLANWLLWESNGYPLDVVVPEYRIWELNLKGHFAGPFGPVMKNAPIPSICVPETIRKQYDHYECRQSAPSLEATLNSAKGTLQLSAGDLSVVLGGDVYEGRQCIEAWAEIAQGNVHERLNSVRNRILDFALEVEKLDPKAGESDTVGASVRIQPASVVQVPLEER